MEPTSIDILIERLGTHPNEFFLEKTLIATANVPQALSVGTKWGKLTQHLLDPDSTLFDKDEKTRFKEALRLQMRTTFDVEIMQTLMTVEKKFGVDEESQKQIGAGVQPSYYTQGGGCGGLFLPGLQAMATQGYSNQQINSAAMSQGSQVGTSYFLSTPQPAKPETKNFIQTLWDSL